MDRRITTSCATRIAASALGLLIGGCSLVPDYARPQTQAVGAWSGVRAADAAMSDAKAAAVEAGPGVQAAGPWWNSFGSGEIDSLMGRSLQSNYNLQAAAARLQEAQATVEISAAPLYPLATLGGTEATSSGVKNSRTHQVLAQASYELDVWGKNRARADSADALANAVAFDADALAASLSGAVLNTYFQILSLNERIALSQQVADGGRRVLGLIQVQQAAGTATQLQVEQQRAIVASFDAAVPALRGQQDLALHALAVLVGQSPSGFKVQAQELTGLVRPTVATDLPSALLERRPDIRAAEARLRSANFDIGVARAAFFPSVSLSAALGLGTASLSTGPSVLAGLGAALLQPLFTGGQLEGTLRVSRARQVELVAAYRQTVLTGMQDVEDQLSLLDRLRAQEKVQAVAEAAARKASDLAQLQYRLGSADYLTVLTTQQTLFTSQDVLLQLRLARLQAIVGLFRALGGGFGAPAAPLPPPNGNTVEPPLPRRAT